MANLPFGEWVWQYHATQDDEIKAHLEQEIVGDGWLYRQDAKTQMQVLEGAPQSFVDEVAPKLKPEVAISLGYNPFMKRS